MLSELPQHCRYLLLLPPSTQPPFFLFFVNQCPFRQCRSWWVTQCCFTLLSFCFLIFFSSSSSPFPWSRNQMASWQAGPRKSPLHCCGWEQRRRRRCTKPGEPHKRYGSRATGSHPATGYRFPGPPRIRTLINLKKKKTIIARPCSDGNFPFPPNSSPTFTQLVGFGSFFGLSPLSLAALQVVQKKAGKK